MSSVKIRTGSQFALVESVCDKRGQHTKHVRTACQASRCPHCNALVAVGPSFDHHVFFCHGGEP